MHKVAIIGGSGFIGTRLISELLSTPDLSVQNIDKAQSTLHSQYTVIGDVLNLELLTKQLAGVQTVVLLAAEHKDNVTPKSLYYTVNAGGMKNVLAAMEANGINNLVFTSTVAIYGLNKENPSEQTKADPFNDYGKSKWQAEELAQAWQQKHSSASIQILRPTVVFGEENRGNVYNLLKQISTGRFMMIGSGNNRKSMAYVGNIVAFISYLIQNPTAGYTPYIYTDKPDMTMNQLVNNVETALGKHLAPIRIPYWIGMCGGYCFDALAFITRKKLAISSVRIKKFCATTEFDSSRVAQCGFKAPFSLEEGLTRTIQREFLNK